MKFTPNSMKWILRFYPPFFFQRIWVKKIYSSFLGADIKILKSIWNMNANRTIFGGTIFSSIDPIHSLLIDSYLRTQGFKKTVAWLKSAQIEFKKPGAKSLVFSVQISPDEMSEAMTTVKEQGKVIKKFTTEIFDIDGVLCAISHNEVYIRDLTFDFNKLQQNG